MPSSAAPLSACALPGTPLEHAKAGIDTCVHCGFCLSTCPTYLVHQDENDSPRGRIYLMRSLYEGLVDVTDDDVNTHIDRCLGCLNCETACPSGVPYGQLLEATRATLTKCRPIPLVARLILWVFARPRLLAAAMAASKLFRMTGVPRLLSRAMPGRLGFAVAMLDATRPAVPTRPYTRRGTGERGTAALLRGCVMEGLFAHTNRATERTLSANDYAMVDAPGQGCCGALHAHAGDDEAARALARRNIDAFERSGAQYVVANAAGCGAAMKGYGHWLERDPAYAERAAALAKRVRDVSELLAAAGPRAGAPLPLAVTYDAPCHLLHGQRVAIPPLEVLGAVPGLDLRPLADADQCCGSAGIYNLIEPETSDAVLARKLENVERTGASLVATGNPGCLMQIGAGLRQAGSGARAVHPVDLLDASYAAEDRS
ncbi:MAG: (Fe-S)-binding protein [Gemmatimonadaceae bacterium]